MLKVPQAFKGPGILLRETFVLISYHLKILSICAWGKTLKEGSDFVIEQVPRFLELYEMEWKFYSSNAKALYDKSKLNIPDKLPSEEDIKGL